LVSKTKAASALCLFVSGEEKDYYRVVSEGQLGFNYRSAYFGFSHRMQGAADI